MADLDKVTALIHSVTGEVFLSADMMILRLLELKQRNEKKLAERSVEMQGMFKTAASRLMIWGRTLVNTELDL